MTFFLCSFFFFSLLDPVTSPDSFARTPPPQPTSALRVVGVRPRFQLLISPFFSLFSAASFFARLIGFSVCLFFINLLFKLRGLFLLFSRAKILPPKALKIDVLIFKKLIIFFKVFEFLILRGRGVSPHSSRFALFEFVAPIARAQPYCPKFTSLRQAVPLPKNPNPDITSHRCPVSVYLAFGGARDFQSIWRFYIGLAVYFLKFHNRGWLSKLFFCVLNCAI